MPVAKITTSIANAMMGSGSLRSLINGGKLYCYTGPVPDTAAEAIDGGSALAITVTESNDGTTGLTFQASPANGVLRKTTAEDWTGTNDTGSSKTLTFFRFCVGSDDGSGVAGGSDHRVQGTIGTDMTFDMWLTNNVIADTEPLALDDFQINLPIA